MRQVPIDPSTSRPAPYRGPVSEIVRWISLAYLGIGGWKMRGDWPALQKMVLVAAPHTSNWDGLNMLAAAAYYRVTLRWMGKRSLTQGPLGWLMLWLGCIPIDRSRENDVVKTMSDQFGAVEQLVLAIPPEGTRSRAPEWKTGFYHIARAANVPIVLSVLDYRTKTMRLAAVVHPTGDYQADLAIIQAHYASATGKKPRQFAI